MVFLVPSGMDSRLTIHAITTCREGALMFHIGPEMTECLMRKVNSAGAKREYSEGHPRPMSNGKIHRQRSQGLLDMLRSDTLASVLLTMRRWLSNSSSSNKGGQSRPQ